MPARFAVPVGLEKERHDRVLEYHGSSPVVESIPAAPRMSPVVESIPRSLPAQIRWGGAGRQAPGFENTECFLFRLSAVKANHMLSLRKE